MAALSWTHPSSSASARPSSESLAVVDATGARERFLRLVIGRVPVERPIDDAALWRCTWPTRSDGSRHDGRDGCQGAAVGLRHSGSRSRWRNDPRPQFALPREEIKPVERTAERGLPELQIAAVDDAVVVEIAGELIDDF